MRKFLAHIFALLTLILPETGLTQLERPGVSSFIQQNQPLPLEHAFPFFVSELSPGKYRITWNLAPGHYLYRHAFEFSLRQTPDGDNLLVEYNLPDGTQKTDQFFGQIEAYYNQIIVDLELTTVPGAEAQLMIHYQGCADWGFCYPPQSFPHQLLP